MVLLRILRMVLAVGIGMLLNTPIVDAGQCSKTGADQGFIPAYGTSTCNVLIGQTLSGQLNWAPGDIHFVIPAQTDGDVTAEPSCRDAEPMASSSDLEGCQLASVPANQNPRSCPEKRKGATAAPSGLASFDGTVSAKVEDCQTDGSDDQQDNQKKNSGFNTPVPEPASLTMLGVGGAALMARRKRKQA